jgi:hypothetical protein
MQCALLVFEVHLIAEEFEAPEVTNLLLSEYCSRPLVWLG